MAMEITHILFARNIEPLLAIQNRSTYFAGSIYPDSRYVTKIPREKTHGPGTPQDPFAIGLSDFEKGWATHLLYDQLSGAYLRNLLKEDPDISSEALITMTAMKVLEDQRSYQRLGEDICLLQLMETPMSPCKEEKDSLRVYYKMNQELYKTFPTIQQYDTFFRKFISSSEYVEQVIQEVHRLSNNQKMKTAILSIYDCVIEEVKKTVSTT